MSTLKEKPLKKCHTDSRQMIDEIHNDIKNELDSDSLHDYYLDNGVLLDQYYKISTERKMNNDNTGILHYFNKETGKSDNETKEIIEDFLGMIKENPELKSNILKEDDKTKLMCLSGVKQYPMRVKCATLSWHTLVSAMENKGKEVSTEN